MSIVCLFYQFVHIIHFFYHNFYSHFTLSDVWFKLQVWVYNNLSPTTAIIGDAIGFQKLSANEQFFVCAQMAVYL